ncbi:hypothetical protein EI94DRAFT_1703271 [Lactarius quietus]|nr:hypothetical protein EI94DRAFT_1703271 [Lactarius quietus]
MSISLPFAINDDLISARNQANAEAKVLRRNQTSLRFARFASDGVTRRNGNVILNRRHAGRRGEGSHANARVLRPVRECTYTRPLALGCIMTVLSAALYAHSNVSLAGLAIKQAR